MQKTSHTPLRPAATAASTPVGPLIATLQNANITVDCVVVGGEADRRVAAVTAQTSGGLFAPPTLTGALKLFEDETVLSWRQCTPAPAGGPCSGSGGAAPSSAHKPKPAATLSEPQVAAIAASTSFSVVGSGLFTRPKPPALGKKALRSIAALRQLTAGGTAAVAAVAAGGGGAGPGKATPGSGAAKAAGSASPAKPPGAPAAGGGWGGGAGGGDDKRRRRVVAELAAIVRNPMATFSVFPCPDNLFLWRCVMRAPDNTPYQGAVYELSIEFVDAYPAASPLIRFTDTIIHCNINGSGKVCHSIFGSRLS